MSTNNGKDLVVPSSDVETDRMDDMEDRESELEQLSSVKSESEEVRKSTTDEDQNVKRPLEENSGEESPVKKVKAEPSEEEHEGDAEEEAEEEDEEEEEEEEEEEDDDGEEEKDKKKMKESKEDEEEEKGEEEAGGSDNDEERRQREEQRMAGMNDLKTIEIKFAQLKDRLYNTQLQKLEFELKLCEENQHPELLDYLKMVDEDFQKKQQRLLNEQKYKLKCLDNQTRATRTQIHQQFMKQCQDLKSEEILEITTDWYDINRERRSMDLMSLNLPEYYQYFGYITPQTVDHYLPDLVNERNGQYKELSELQGLLKYKKLMPSSLNYLKGCSKDEQEQDLKDIGILS